jgi:hypothetical protein
MWGWWSDKPMKLRPVFIIISLLLLEEKEKKWVMSWTTASMIKKKKEVKRNPICVPQRTRKAGSNAVQSRKAAEQCRMQHHR